MVMENDSFGYIIRIYTQKLEMVPTDVSIASAKASVSLDAAAAVSAHIILGGVAVKHVCREY
jgi:hypothetical protein